MRPLAFPILVVNKDKTPPGTEDRLRSLGITFIVAEEKNTPAVALLEERKDDRRFKAACAAMSGWLAGRSGPLTMRDRVVLARSSVDVADDLISMLDKTGG